MLWYRKRYNSIFFPKELPPHLYQQVKSINHSSYSHWDITITSLFFSTAPPSWPPACQWGVSPWAVSLPSPAALWWTQAALAPELQSPSRQPARWAARPPSATISTGRAACSSTVSTATAPTTRKPCRVSTTGWPTTWTRCETLKIMFFYQPAAWWGGKWND